MTDKEIQDCAKGNGADFWGVADLSPARAFIKEHSSFIRGLQKPRRERDARWTESIAVGSEAFVRATKERFGIKAVGRDVTGGDGSYELRESNVSYGANFQAENGDLSQENAFFWDESI